MGVRCGVNGSAAGPPAMQRWPWPSGLAGRANKSRPRALAPQVAMPGDRQTSKAHSVPPAEKSGMGRLLSKKTQPAGYAHRALRRRVQPLLARHAACDWARVVLGAVVVPRPLAITKDEVQLVGIGRDCQLTAPKVGTCRWGRACGRWALDIWVGDTCLGKDLQGWHGTAGQAQAGSTGPRCARRAPSARGAPSAGARSSRSASPSGPSSQALNLACSCTRGRCLRARRAGGAARAFGWWGQRRRSAAGGGCERQGRVPAPAPQPQLLYCR
jgi:hypothetical protein